MEPIQLLVIGIVELVVLTLMIAIAFYVGRRTAPSVGTSVWTRRTGPFDELESLTASARRVVALGDEESKRLNSPYVGTEHFLLALLREPEGVAMTVFVNLGLDLDKVRSIVEIMPATEMSLVPNGRSFEAEHLVAQARAEARRLNQSVGGAYSTGTEHLLLALFEFGGDTVASTVLESFGVTRSKIRVEIAKTQTQKEQTNDHD